MKSVKLGSILKLSHALGCAPGGLLADFTQSQIRKLVRSLLGGSIRRDQLFDQRLPKDLELFTFGAG